MQTPIIPISEPAKEAVDLEKEILARLDALAASEGQSDVAASKEPEPEPEPEPEQSPEPQAPTMQEQLDALERVIDVAVDSGNEDEVRRLCQQGRDIIRAEKASREESLQEAQDYFDVTLKKHGESAEETALALKEVSNWKKSLEKFDDSIAQQDDYYDAIISQMHPPPTIEATSIVEHADEPVVISVEHAQTRRELIDQQRVRIQELRALIAEIEIKKKLEDIKKARGISVQ